MKRTGPLLFVLISCGLAGNGAHALKRIPAPRFAGRYNIIIRDAGNQSEEYKSSGKFWIRLNFTPPKENQLQYTWGQFYGGIPLTDDQRAEVRMSQWSNHEWKRNALVMKFDKACSSAMTHAKFFLDLVYRKDEIRCPTPVVGHREIKNTTINPAFPKFPVLPYSRYLTTVAIIEKDETVGVIVCDNNIIPK